MCQLVMTIPPPPTTSTINITDAATQNICDYKHLSPCEGCDCPGVVLSDGQVNA